MLISGTGGSAFQGGSAAQTGKQEGDDALASFLSFMKQTPAQMMRSQWLTAHHLTEQQLAAMPPEQREAIDKQMAQDIEKQAAQQASHKIKSPVSMTFD